MVFSEIFNRKIQEKQIDQIFSTPLYHFRMLYYKDLSDDDSKLRWHLLFRFEYNSFCIIKDFGTSEKQLFQYHDDNDAGCCVLQLKPGEYNLPFRELTYLDCNIKTTKDKKSDKHLKENIDWKIGINNEIKDINFEFLKLVIDKISKSPFTPKWLIDGFKEHRPELFETEIIAPQGIQQ